MSSCLREPMKALDDNQGAWYSGSKEASEMKKASKEVREFLAAAGKKGGKKKSAAKTAAARVNIKKRWEGK